jgi:hypothetical protein
VIVVMMVNIKDKFMGEHHTHTHMHACKHRHTYIHTRTYIHTFLRTHTYIHFYTHAHIHTYILAHIHICIHPRIHTYTSTRMHTSTHAHACIHACWHASIHMNEMMMVVSHCMQTFMAIYIYTCSCSWDQDHRSRMSKVSQRVAHMHALSCMVRALMNLIAAGFGALNRPMHTCRPEDGVPRQTRRNASSKSSVFCCFCCCCCCC